MALKPARSNWSLRRLTGGLRSPTRWVRRLLKLRFRRAGLAPYRLELGDGHLHVWSGGKGSETLVLLHGFGGSCLWQWADMVGALAKRYRLLVPDLLWFGDSDGEAAQGSLKTQAAAIRALLESVGEPAHVAGISYGGFVGYMIADEHPELVRSLTLIDCPATVMGKDDYHRVLERFAIPDMNELLVPDQPSVLPDLLALAYHRPPRVPKFAWRDAHHHLFTEHRAKRVELLDDLIAYLETPYTEQERHHPVLILWGEHDALFPVSLARRLKEHLGGRAQLEIIPNTAHAPIVEAPKTINSLLLRFLAGQTQSV